MDRRYSAIEPSDRRFEPPPPELAEAGLKVDFISILAEAHALVRAGSIERQVDYMTRIAQMSPETLDIVDWDGQAKKYADLTNQPDGTMRDDIDIERLASELEPVVDPLRHSRFSLTAARSGISEAVQTPPGFPAE